ncbi:MAG: sulfatase-like hydrolase/transferase [Minicystis sp.]
MSTSDDPPPEAETAKDPAPRAPTLPISTRGLGLLAGVLTFGVVGLADGLLTLQRAPRGAVALRLALLVVFHAVAVQLTLGLIVGALEELVLASARRTPLLARFGAWAIAGPRRWFTVDPPAATGLLAALLGLALSLAPLFPATKLIIAEFHSPLLAALAVVLIALASMLFAGLLVATAAAPLHFLVKRAGKLASPGAITALALLAILVLGARFARREWATVQNLEIGVAALTVLLLIANLTALLLLGARIIKRAKPLGVRTPLLAATLALVAFFASATTYGKRQTVAAMIGSRSVLAKHVVHGLQLAIDFDHDGYSPLFGGGDCNDGDPQQNPGAVDIPANGVDENCSGADARVEVDESDGQMVPLDRSPARPSFLFISIDAMRPDHMGAYGYRRPTTPNIDAWAKDAARFTNAFCASPRSLRSFASLWTGRYASLVAWGDDVQYPPLREENVTLAELLAQSGYATGAFNNVSYFSNTQGFFQGFAQVSDGTSFKGDSAPAVDKLLTFVRAQSTGKTPFFAWIHLMEPHDPYDDRSEPKEFGHEPMDQYDEAIARADELVAPLLALAGEVGKDQPLLTFVFGDHGEGFGEHGVFHHSFDLHDEALRVPLLVRGPSIAPGPREALTSLFDLHPTLLNLAALKAGAPLSGRSLLPILKDLQRGNIVSPLWRDHLYGEVIPDGIFPAEHKSLYQPPFKVLSNLRRGTWELYDIAHDRNETKNLYDDRPDIALPLRERLLSWASGALDQRESAARIAAARLPAEPPMQHPIHVEFGDVMELLGYDLPEDRVPIGGTIKATFYYRVLTRTRESVWMNLRFEPLDGGRQLATFHARHFPIYGRYPTTKWQPGEILKDEILLRIEPDVRPTRMRIKLSLETDQSKEVIPPRSRATPKGALELDVLEVLPAAK